ncbi:MAG: hypothetical protein IJ537_07615 [Bacteroidaceae bacterium]|nr:hypothetical protein [Bacteroidaceae bacterium]
MFNLNCPMIMAQEDKSVPATDSIKALGEPREPDSLAVDTAALLSVSDNVLRNVRPRRDLKSFRPEPIRSMWLALVLPGAGQIYNRKYWKLPIIYGGFLGCVYALTWNSQMLSDYSQAYLDIMDSDPGTKSYEKMLPPNYSIVGKEERFKGIFKSKRDTFRRFRDLSIFAFGGVYLLSVIDAYVDAELSTFDISHDLSMQVLPTMIETERFDMHHRTTTPGVKCVINF